jgi:hypothetical protein
MSSSSDPSMSSVTNHDNERVKREEIATRRRL